jgi:Ca-activated chloride channel family protein
VARFARFARALAVFVGVAALACGATACSGSGGSGSSGNDASSGTSDANSPNTLRVLAGSELKDLEPFLGDLRAKTGVSVSFVYSGTLAGVERIRSGETFDAAWFASDKYLVLADAAHRVKDRERIMLSPVVLGVKASVAKKFGWTSSGVTWKDIAAKSASGQFHFAMTNPTASNSGFSAVIAVASALAGASDALRPSDVNTAKLRTFFSGQSLTAGSSGWLIDAYVRDQDKLDGIVNYEASLLALNSGNQLHEPLTLLYPKEGVMTADYPLVLLDASKKAAFDKVVAYFRSPDVQRSIMQKTFRRPTVSDVALDSIFPKALINEVAFPSSLAAVDGILARFLNQERVPAHTFYVLDTSGSMDGDRIDGVRAALGTLAGDDTSLTGTFARFQARERITLISFSDAVTAPVDLEMHSADDTVTLGKVKDYAKALDAGGSTAIYCALETALADAAKSRATDGGRLDSIVLMTDGENNRCDDVDAFEKKYRALPATERIRIFPILFGEGSAEELQHIADITGGRLFNGKTQSLSEVFKEIRGYQ